METKQTAMSTALTAAGIKEASQAMPRLHGKGAKSSKVPAVPGASEYLAKEANEEATDILTHLAGRMARWVRIANACKGQPDLLKAYPNMVRDSLFKQAGLPIPNALKPLSQWTNEKDIQMAKMFGVQVSQARKAFDNLALRFTATMKTLEGKGTFQQKLAALPNLSTKGAKKREPQAPESTERGGSKKKREEAQAATSKGQTPISIAVNAIQTMPESDLVRVIQAAAIRCKASKDIKLVNLSADLFKALDTFDATENKASKAA